MNVSTKVTAGEIVSSTRKYSNVDDDNRKFNINVDVVIQDGKATQFNSGTLNRRASDAYGHANFSCGMDMSHFSFNSNGLSYEEIKEAINTLYSFIKEVNADIESLNKDE